MISPRLQKPEGKRDQRDGWMDKWMDAEKFSSSQVHIVISRARSSPKMNWGYMFLSYFLSIGPVYIVRSTRKRIYLFWHDEFVRL